MTARKPQARLTKRDEKAIEKMLAEADDVAVSRFMVKVHQTESMLSDAKARLTRKRITDFRSDAWAGGYCAAMEEMMTVTAEMCSAGLPARLVMLAVFSVAEGARDIYYNTEFRAAKWSES